MTFHYDYTNELQPIFNAFMKHTGIGLTISECEDIEHELKENGWEFNEEDKNKEEK